MERVLLDNDVVFKLSQYGLLDELLALTMGPGSVRILPTLRYRFRLEHPAKAIKIMRDAEAVNRLKAFVAKVRELEDEPATELIAQLEDTPQIDPGEVVLFAAAAADTSSHTYTGDKRALVALANSKSAVRLADNLGGRIKCLEQLVAEMLLCPNGNAVLERIRGKEWDTALRICCSSGYSEAMSGLRSYYDHLNTECDSILAPFPHST